MTDKIKDVDNMSFDLGLAKLSPTNNVVDATLGYKLGDFVWFDADKNGIQDESNYGIEGIIAKLYNQNGQFIAETKTNSKGEYLFTDLQDGVYTVEFTNVPEPLKKTTSLTGSDITVDSNGIKTTGEIDGADNLTLDLGLIARGDLTKDELIELGIDLPIGSIEVPVLKDKGKTEGITLDIESPFGGTQLPKTGESIPLNQVILGIFLVALGLRLRRK